MSSFRLIWKLKLPCVTEKGKRKPKAFHKVDSSCTEQGLFQKPVASLSSVEAEQQTDGTGRCAIALGLTEKCEHTQYTGRKYSESFTQALLEHVRFSAACKHQQRG